MLESRGRQSRRRKGDLWWRERGRSGLFLRACSQGSPQGAGTPRGPKGDTLTEDSRPKMASLPFPFPFSLLLHGASGPTQISTARAASRQAREESRPSAWWTFWQGLAKRGWAGDGTGELGKVGSREATTRAAPGPSPGPCRCRPIPPCSGQQRLERRQRRGSRASSPPPLPSDSVSWNKQAFRLAGPFFETSNLHYHPHHSTTSTTPTLAHRSLSSLSCSLWQTDSRHVSSRWLPSNS